MGGWVKKPAIFRQYCGDQGFMSNHMRFQLNNSLKAAGFVPGLYYNADRLKTEYDREKLFNIIRTFDSFNLNFDDIQQDIEDLFKAESVALPTTLMEAIFHLNQVSELQEIGAANNVLRIAGCNPDVSPSGHSPSRRTSVNRQKLLKGLKYSQTVQDVKE